MARCAMNLGSQNVADILLLGQPVAGFVPSKVTVHVRLSPPSCHATKRTEGPIDQRRNGLCAA